MKLTAISKEDLEAMFSEDKSSEEVLELIWPHLEELLNSTLEEMDEKIEELKEEREEFSGQMDERFTESSDSLLKSIEEQKTFFEKALETVEKAQEKERKQLSRRIDTAEKVSQAQGKDLSQAFNLQHEAIRKSIDSLRAFVSDVNEFTKETEELLKKDIKDSKKELLNILEGLRIDLFSRLGQRGGGNANRSIIIGGNSSTLAYYTDINLKAGSNVTITYTPNNTTKYTDITVAATGGGGGTVRSINNISTSQTAGATTGTDYVYVCTDGIALTLPTAVGNTNLYTIKNTGTSSVLVLTTGAETIDAGANALLGIQYTAIDLISDSTNWNVT